MWGWNHVSDGCLEFYRQTIVICFQLYTANLLWLITIPTYLPSYFTLFFLLIYSLLYYCIIFHLIFKINFLKFHFKKMRQGFHSIINFVCIEMGWKKCFILTGMQTCGEHGFHEGFHFIRWQLSDSMAPKPLVVRAPVPLHARGWLHQRSRDPPESRNPCRLEQLVRSPAAPHVRASEPWPPDVVPERYHFSNLQPRFLKPVRLQVSHVHPGDVLPCWRPHASVCVWRNGSREAVGRREDTRRVRPGWARAHTRELETEVDHHDSLRDSWWIH